MDPPRLVLTLMFDVFDTVLDFGSSVRELWAEPLGGQTHRRVRPALPVAKGRVLPWGPNNFGRLRARKERSRQRGPVSRVLSPSVSRGDGHFSRTPVARRLQRPYPRAPRGPRFTWSRDQDRSPIGPCSGWGLPSRRGHPRRW